MTPHKLWAVGCQRQQGQPSRCVPLLSVACGWHVLAGLPWPQTLSCFSLPWPACVSPTSRCLGQVFTDHWEGRRESSQRHCKGGDTLTTVVSCCPAMANHGTSCVAGDLEAPEAWVSQLWVQDNSKFWVKNKYTSLPAITQALLTCPLSLSCPAGPLRLLCHPSNAALHEVTSLHGAPVGPASHRLLLHSTAAPCKHLSVLQCMIHWYNALITTYTIH